ncbi:MAG: hypothetical protein GTN84_16545 [Hydrogenophaga sp.]|uniref:hypothetical protein n=1 Tax=Hydrogenophaga sp. TaxID=1904254 RepID=UPI0016974EEE|nr:hypothetical protein [Hydrogenophaga sp.]NIM42991.1 hypothetical protein [Hydrogenophaga sp.]NIN27921.1 hypothetical protein [Hydrogenophaga sp.]NIN32698.1 hypothetical protein [Hydrogenophaga sp.]NIN57194.1 hypothetical protein [Hydrogenophaga sp.]NIO53610.1 hypothetical protein [Hydrogenophaga sp.]
MGIRLSGNSTTAYRNATSIETQASPGPVIVADGSGGGVHQVHGNGGAHKTQHANATHSKGEHPRTDAQKRRRDRTPGLVYSRRANKPGPLYSARPHGTHGASKPASTPTSTPPIVPPGTLVADASNRSLDAWWSPVNLSDLARNCWAWYGAGDREPAPAAQGSQQAGTANPVTRIDGVCAIGQGDCGVPATVTTIGGLNNLVANTPTNARWKVKLSPSLAKRADRTLRGTVVVVSDPAHRDPAVKADRQALRAPLLGSNSILMPENDGECVHVSACVALDVSEAEARLHEADVRAIRTASEFFELVARFDPSLKRQWRADLVAEDLMALALASLKDPKVVAKLSSQDEGELVQGLQVASDAIKAFLDLIKATSLPRSQDMMRRIKEVRALHPEATLVVDTGAAHAADFEADPDFSKTDYAVLHRAD